MLGAHIRVVELPCFRHGELEYFFGARGVRQLPQRDRGLSPADGLFHPLLHLLQINRQVGEHRGGHTFSLANQPEQDVFGADVIVL